MQLSVFWITLLRQRKSIAYTPLIIIVAIIVIDSLIHPSYLNHDLESYKNRLIYCSHGSLDDVIPLSIVDDHILKLSKNNDLTYDKFDSGHTISQENLIRLLNWINDTSI